MPVDIDDTTKLSEEQRKFFSISTGSPSRRRRKTSTTFDLPYPTTNCANASSATSGKHTLSNGWAKSLDKKFVENSKEDLFSPSCSFFKLLFDRNVHRDGAIFSMHAQLMIVMQHRTGAPHSVTRPRGAARWRAPDPGVESWSRRRWSSISMLILDPDLECHLLTFNRLLVVFCHILSTTGE